MKTLETERLILREWHEKDAGEYFELYKNPEVEDAGAKICKNINESLEYVDFML